MYNKPLVYVGTFETLGFRGSPRREAAGSQPSRVALTAGICSVAAGKCNCSQRASPTN